jgi:hypothetical protein
MFLPKFCWWQLFPEHLYKQIKWTILPSARALNMADQCLGFMMAYIAYYIIPSSYCSYEVNSNRNMDMAQSDAYVSVRHKSMLYCQWMVSHVWDISSVLNWLETRIMRPHEQIEPLYPTLWCDSICVELTLIARRGDRIILSRQAKEL